MRKEDALKMSERAVTELAEELAAGKSEQLVMYLDAMSRFHQYSFGNCMLIARQRPEATRVAGFTMWKKLGRIVKKGEKGICILAPMVRKQGECEESEKSEDKGAKLIGFRAVHVFDVTQTEGDELPEFASVTGDPGESLTLLRGVALRRGITLTYEASLGGAEGLSRGGAILLLEKLTPAAEFATLAHELAHELLHHGKDRGDYSKATCELEAEATAYVVVKAAGLENGLRQSADYLHLYLGDQERLVASLDRIRWAASEIIVGLDEVGSRAKKGSASA